MACLACKLEMMAQQPSRFLSRGKLCVMEGVYFLNDNKLFIWNCFCLRRKDRNKGTNKKSVRRQQSQTRARDLNRHLNQLGKQNNNEGWQENVGVRTSYINREKIREQICIFGRAREIDILLSPSSYNIWPQILCFYIPALCSASFLGKENEKLCKRISG